MSNVIEFLERLGQDADLSQATSEVLAEELRRAGVEPALQAAILANDRRALEALLGADTNVCCMVHSPDDDEEEEEEEEDDEEKEDDEQAKLDSVVRSRRRLDRVA